MKLPGLTPHRLQSWLKANGKTEIVDAGFHPLVAFALGTGQQGMPPVPDDVLGSWANMLGTERILVLQGAMALIRQAHRAGKSDDDIRRMLLLDKDVSLEDHFAELQREVEDIQVRKAETLPGDTGELQGEMDAADARITQARAERVDPTQS